MKVLALVVALVACGRTERGPIDREKARALFAEVPIADSPHGMSDLAIDDRGRLWAIPERDPTVLELELAGGSVVGTRHAIDGVPAGMDTEGIGWLGGRRFALALEGAHVPAAAIAFAELGDDGRLSIKSTRVLTAGELGVEPTTNRGLESICGRGDELLTATENAGTFPDGTRWAALVRVRGEALHVTKLRLTSKEGKISALHCTLADDGTAEVVAIERHFGVCRILRFAVGRDDAEVTPVIDLDLTAILRDALNLEGIARLPDGRLVSINDNQSRTAKGPTELLVFHPR
jgi:hypothetical protein